MTTQTAIALPEAVDPRAALATFDRLVIERLHDRQFWMVQAVIVAMVGLHCGTELTGISETALGERIGLHHLVVLLFLVPVVFASLRFGLEGGFLAGATCLVLTAPNLFLWHRGGYEWVGELIAMLVVFGVGVAVAAPVERERLQWRRAEETSRRLGVVNGIVEMLAEANEPETAVDALLERLVDAVDLRGVAVQVAEPRLVAVRARGWSSAAALRAAVGAATGAGSDPAAEGVEVAKYPLTTDGPPLGVLAVQADRLLRPDDEALLAAVAHHLALEFEHAGVQRRERDRLQGYARAVVAAQEAERARIARDLHDDVAQPLVQLGRGLGSVADLQSAPLEVVGRCEALRELSLSTLALVRRFAQHLRPSALDDLGLVAATAAFVREQGERCHADVEFDVDGAERRLSPDTEVAAFRIAQEALRNVEKHACASHVWVRLGFEDDALRVSIEDDGVGLDAAARRRRCHPGGLGIEGMRERAAIAGGTFRIRRGERGGTIVEATLPV